MSEVDKHLGIKPEQGHIAGPDDFDDYWELAFPSDYIRWCDLRGRPWVLTLKDILRNQKVDTTEGPKVKPYIWLFQKTDKRFIANKTNCRSAAGFLTGHWRKWPGGDVELFPTTCMVGRNKVNCIRVREPGSGQ